jgi:hypothetical protein
VHVDPTEHQGPPGEERFAHHQEVAVRRGDLDRHDGVGGLVVDQDEVDVRGSPHQNLIGQWRSHSNEWTVGRDGAGNQHACRHFRRQAAPTELSGGSPTRDLSPFG